MTTEPRRDIAMEAMMADLEVQHVATLARRAREAADKRFTALADYIAMFEDVDLRDGVQGFHDMVGNLMSSRHWRMKRAQSLMVARKQQLFGHRPSVRFWLAKAAEQRVTEQRFRRAEKSAGYRDLIAGAAGYPEFPSTLIAAE